MSGVIVDWQEEPVESHGQLARLAAFLGHCEAAGRGLGGEGKSGDEGVDPDEVMEGEDVVDKVAFLEGGRAMKGLESDVVVIFSR